MLPHWWQRNMKASPVDSCFTAHNLGILKTLFLEEILKFMEASKASLSLNLSQREQNQSSKHRPKMSHSSLSHPPWSYSPSSKRTLHEKQKFTEDYLDILEILCFDDSCDTWLHSCQTAFFLWKFNEENTVYIDKMTNKGFSGKLNDIYSCKIERQQHSQVALGF